ncbi:hypothetical protein BAUCODRAFT_178834 [Baudoinia panamericana UAMH 10762]|uniref:Uncharacterized protein n=1 Tax=Baudoinia panamericana (strain UAMH 10762) TaxID=717646 RepID=M2M0X3_BAUPA|nr:uncharacterized protein BAUCODRAFT_178834 [Baudoinia panamericana UAMH 10762]EMD00668.1 hypothetical protein BAUCODRAFT_178834 [Baudoinia panamericana UAMH 10762]
MFHAIMAPRQTMLGWTRSRTLSFKRDGGRYPLNGVQLASKRHDSWATGLSKAGLPLVQTLQRLHLKIIDESLCHSLLHAFRNISILLLLVGGEVGVQAGFDIDGLTDAQPLSEAGKGN